MKGIETESVPSEAGLRAGDILIDISPSGPTHAAIYLGNEKEIGSKLTTAHADYVTHERVLRTSLPQGNYSVYRCKDPEIAKIAANLAKNWASYNDKTGFEKPFKNQLLEVEKKQCAPTEKADYKAQSKEHLNERKNNEQQMKSYLEKKSPKLQTYESFQTSPKK